MTFIKIHGHNKWQIKSKHSACIYIWRAQVGLCFGLVPLIQCVFAHLVRCVRVLFIFHPARMWEGERYRWRTLLGISSAMKWTKEIECRQIELNWKAEAGKPRRFVENIKMHTRVTHKLLYLSLVYENDAHTSHTAHTHTHTHTTHTHPQTQLIT